MMEDRTSVLVSGAGVAGLTVAHWLIRYGFDVTVVERARHLRPGGQALDVRGPALEVAERMGVLDTIRERSTKQAGMSVVDGDGKEIYRSTERTLTGGRLDSPDVEILRDELCAVLHRAAGGQIEYLFGDRVTALEQDEAGVDVAFANAPARRFDLVIGADGLHSGVRRLAFGPEKQFIRTIGGCVAVFSMPNFLGLDRWQVFCEHAGVFGGVLGLRADLDIRTYLGFDFDKTEPLDYDYRDVDAQKKLVADRAAGAGWVFPQIIEHMWRTPDFYFDAMSQIRMDAWSAGRVVLVGDAGYCVSPATGQGTTVAMAAAYVLAGELAAHHGDLAAGVAAYEAELRHYVVRNQDSALRPPSEPQAALGEPTDAYPAANSDGIPDFGEMVQPLALKHYRVPSELQASPSFPWRRL